jgi:hypothetical protein
MLSFEINQSQIDATCHSIPTGDANSLSRQIGQSIAASDDDHEINRWDHISRTSQAYTGHRLYHYDKQQQQERRLGLPRAPAGSLMRTARAQCKPRKEKSVLRRPVSTWYRLIHSSFDRLVFSPSSFSFRTLSRRPSSMRECWLTLQAR